MKRFSPHFPSFVFQRAFTLIEMLVSMSVLALLIVLVAQLTNSATVTITSSRKHLDADSEARVVLDWLAIDFGHMLMRPDVDSVVKGYYTDYPTNTADMLASGTYGNNDTIWMFSESAGYYSSTDSPSNTSTACLVGYRVNPIGSPTYSLERYGTVKSWEDSANGTPLMFLAYNGTSTTPVAGSSMISRWGGSGIIGNASNNFGDGSPSADWLTSGGQVFRFEYCYLLKNGTYSVVPYITKPTQAGHGFKDVSAIVVAIAILDANSRKVVSDASMLTLVNAFPDVSASDLSTSPPKLMAQTWNAKILSPDFATTVGIPQLAASQIRVYQRVYYLNKI